MQNHPELKNVRKQIYQILIRIKLIMLLKLLKNIMNFKKTTAKTMQ